MNFIRNTWYPALWASELTPQGPMPVKPIARKICGEDIVFYRSQKTNKIVALHDMCPHRFAPLSFGDVKGDGLRCKYHGLEFDSTGECVKDPGADVAKMRCIKAYPVQQNEELVYIWIGDGEPDTPAPDFTGAMLREGYSGAVRGFLEAPVHWQLLVDNLNDDAHATNLHALLNTESHTDRNKYKRRIEQDELQPNSVTQYIDLFDTPCIPLFKTFVKDPTAIVNQQIRIHWMAPGTCNITSGVYAPGSDPETQTGVDSMHMVTPADENSCYYFWCFKRNANLEDHFFSENMSKMLEHIFTTEDVWMAIGQSERMKGRDFWSMKPALLPQDKAAVLVRRRIEKLLKENDTEAE